VQFSKNVFGKSHFPSGGQFGRLEMAQHTVNHAHEDHRFAALGQFFVILAQPAIPTEAAKCPFHNLSFGQHNKAGRVVATLHDLQHPAADLRNPANQLSCIAAVSPNQLQARKASLNSFQHQLGAVTILNVARMDHQAPNQTQRVHQQMPLTPLYLLAGVVAATDPLFSVVFTDWLSMIAALGCCCFPCFTRTRFLTKS